MTQPSLNGVQSSPWFKMMNSGGLYIIRNLSGLRRSRFRILYPPLVMQRFGAGDESFQEYCAMNVSQLGGV